MPDHLHFLATGAETACLPHFISAFKQKSSHEFKRMYKQHLWQRSYYDHVLRKEESLENIGLYILNNPVRAGFVDDFKKYEFVGSTVFDIHSL